MNIVSVYPRYSINGYFTFTFEPTQFTLKPHHTKLCVVHCKTYDKPLNFRYLPAVLEVHKILDKSTQIAQELLTDIESIDDPKWREDSYVEHIFLHIDLKVNFPKIETIAVNGIDEKSIQPPLTTSSMPESLVASMKENNIITIFEKLFWDYLSRSNFMRNTGKIPRDLSYEDVVLQRSGENRRNSMNISNNSRYVY